MRIFITGGTGFIGSHVVQNLKSLKHNLLILSRKPPTLKENNIHYIKGSLSNINKWAKTLANFHPQATIHIAWEGLPDHSFEISQKNLIFSLNLCQTVAKIGCKRFVSIGSCWEYGKKLGKLKETNEILPFDPFSASKHAFRLLGSEIAKNFGMEFIWTRLFYVYGPGQHRHSLIPHLIESIHPNAKPQIRNPLAKNDFIYVEDVAEALSTLTTKKINHFPENNIFNIGSGKLTSISAIISYIFNTYHKELKINKVPTLSKDQFTGAYADISKIKKYYSWQPKTDIKEGINKTIALSKLYNQTLGAR